MILLFKKVALPPVSENERKIEIKFRERPPEIAQTTESQQQKKAAKTDFEPSEMTDTKEQYSDEQEPNISVIYDGQDFIDAELSPTPRSELAQSPVPTYDKEVAQLYQEIGRITVNPPEPYKIDTRQTDPLLDRLFAYPQVDVVGRGLALLHQKLGENGLYLHREQLAKFIGFIRGNDIQDYPAFVQRFLHDTDGPSSPSIKVHLDLGCFWLSRTYVSGFTMRLPAEDMLDIIRRVKPTGWVNLSYQNLASLTKATMAEKLDGTNFNVQDLCLLGTGLRAAEALHLMTVLRPNGDVDLRGLDLSSWTPEIIQKALGSLNLEIQGLNLSGTKITGPAALALIVATKATKINLNDVNLSKLTVRTIHDQLYRNKLAG